MDDKSYLKINTDLTRPTHKLPPERSSTGYGLRDDLYQFWFEEMSVDGGQCELLNQNYSSKYHSNGKQPALDRCFEKLDNHIEYVHLRDMFLLEYENCMSSIENTSSLKTFFNTICLDAIAVRRLIIEYNTCCADRDGLSITSTLCSFGDTIDKNFLTYNLSMLINHTKQLASLGIARIQSKTNSNCGCLLFCITSAASITFFFSNLTVLIVVVLITKWLGLIGSLGMIFSKKRLKIYVIFCIWSSFFF
jgi:hypothetical protein